MLYLNHRLLFPSLVYQKDFTIKMGSKSKGNNKKPSWVKKVKLYKLDWDNIEFKKEEYHKKWNKNSWPNLELPYISSIPEELDKEIKDYIFALDRGYLDEIRRCSQQGIQEWNIPKPFDTIIKDMCLDVPQSYIRVAFHLLSDCIFDKKTSYWSRGNRKESACLMLYKFWCHQTGNGLLRSRKFTGWDDEYIWQKKWTVEGESRNRIEKINELLSHHQKKLDESMSKIQDILTDKD